MRGRRGGNVHVCVGCTCFSIAEFGVGKYRISNIDQGMPNDEVRKLNRKNRVAVVSGTAIYCKQSDFFTGWIFRKVECRPESKEARP